ncbi:hypothetical protein A3Q56_08401 [Intoshia linei]|uniref:PiggyBac transposable element-derived protein domain-containing protein n=1 Tax=Intoshia linei TaxID=1819745 RepID=A0A177APG1_9BILA|nr:hypothetical protein A3Q56_08401 [Intoshia linei]
MVPYFRRHSAKMFIKSKPIRYGYKIWCLCGNDGYPYNLSINQGKNINVDKLPLSRRVINVNTEKRKLCYSIYHTQDNYNL